jgi:hypothetical protein
MEGNFTKQFLQSLKAPASGRLYVADTREKGLSVSVTPNGTITFFVRKRINGRDERVVIGRYPETTIERARTQALAIKAQVAQGKDPIEDKRRMRSDITFFDMFQEFMERYSKKHKRSWQYDEREVNKFLSHWFKRKSSTITKQEIQILHERLRDENGLYQANRILERISAIFNRAIEWGWHGENPAHGVRKFREKSRDRFLQPDELPRFFAALEAEDNQIARDYIMLSLLTGARKSNVLAMRWDEIHFERAEWRIPETKNGDPLTVPLSQQAIEILAVAGREPTANGFFPFKTAGQAISPIQSGRGSAYWLGLALRIYASTTFAGRLEAGRRPRAQAASSSASRWGINRNKRRKFTLDSILIPCVNP